MEKCIVFRDYHPYIALNTPHETKIADARINGVDCKNSSNQEAKIYFWRLFQNKALQQVRYNALCGIFRSPEGNRTPIKSLGNFYSIR